MKLLSFSGSFRVCSLGYILDTARETCPAAAFLPGAEHSRGGDRTSHWQPKKHRALEPPGGCPPSHGEHGRQGQPLGSAPPPTRIATDQVWDSIVNKFIFKLLLKSFFFIASYWCFFKSISLLNFLNSSQKTYCVMKNSN